MRTPSDKTEIAILSKNRRRSVLAIKVYLVILIPLVAVLFALNKIFGLPSWIVWSVTGLQCVFIAFDVWNVVYLTIRLRRYSTTHD